MTTNYDQQISIIKQKVKEIARKANLDVPEIKISEKEDIASACFLKKKIVIGTKMLHQLKNGEIDEDDVEAILAHEIGHLMDFDRKFRSVYFQGTVVGIAYLIFGIILLGICLILASLELRVMSFYLFLLWSFFLPWILRKNSLAAQFEADRNASKLIGNLKLANYVTKKFKFYSCKKINVIETWRRLYHVIFYPSFSETLQNLGFEIKEFKMDIQKRE